MDYNVCKFLPRKSDAHTLNIINLVYETECRFDNGLKAIATYRMHFIVSGKGVLHTENRETELNPGDVLIMPPAIPFTIESTENIKYIYISYLGIRANALAQQFKIENSGNIYNGYEGLSFIWESLFTLPDEIVNMRAESVLLYTFSEIGRKIFAQENEKRIAHVAQTIKELIDDEFNDTALNVERISEKLSYHRKYVSRVFKREFNISITEYLKTLRMQNACTLMEQGITSIQDISFLSGYNDPLYFSRVFKSEMGISPRQHIKQLKTENQKATIG